METTRRDQIVVKKDGNELSQKWYAVYTRSRFEKQVLKGLLDQDIEAYLPLIKTVRQWSDRKKTADRLNKLYSGGETLARFGSHKVPVQYFETTPDGDPRFSIRRGNILAER